MLMLDFGGIAYIDKLKKKLKEAGFLDQSILCKIKALVSDHCIPVKQTSSCIFCLLEAHGDVQGIKP